MKLVVFLMASTLAAVSASAGEPAALTSYETQIGYQRGVVLQEKKALDQAFAARDNSVHLSKDFLNVLAYGVSTGYLTMDFLRRTNNLESIRTYFAKNNVPANLAPTESHVVSPTEAAVVADEATYASVPEKAAMARKIGSVAFRTTELASAAVLGVFFVGNVIDTGKDLVIRFKDTDDIKEHRQKLSEAARNLKTADENLQVAVASESN